MTRGGGDVRDRYSRKTGAMVIRNQKSVIRSKNKTLKNRRRHNFLAAAFPGVLALATTGARAYPAFGVTIKPTN